MVTVTSPHGFCRWQSGFIFSRRVSCLDAFSTYLLARGCWTIPFRITRRLEAPIPCSSRTEGTFLS
ncbi:MAG: hypothetical protein ACXAB2_10805, partial [Candidatus Hodarchaeales archaeon]